MQCDNDTVSLSASALAALLACRSRQANVIQENTRTMASVYLTPSSLCCYFSVLAALVAWRSRRATAIRVADATRLASCHTT
jgi:hypothetical protein